jgi:hypothetical protein
MCTLEGPDTPLGVRDIVAGFAAAVSGGQFPVFGAVPVHQFLAACARSADLRERYQGLLLRVRDRLAAAARIDQRSAALRGDVDPELTAGLLLALALGVGTLTELGVPFDPPAHSRVVLQLLGPGERKRR